LLIPSFLALAAVDMLIFIKPSSRLS